MLFSRGDYAQQINDKLLDFSSKLKARSRAGLTDDCRSLEPVMQRFFNQLWGWNLINLNAGKLNFPAIDLGDLQLRIAIQITINIKGSKIIDTAECAKRHGIYRHFDKLIIFFLNLEKPAFPKEFKEPEAGPKLECMDITDILKQTICMEDVDALKRALSILEEETQAHLTATPLHRYFQALIENFATYENLGLPPAGNSEDEKDVRIDIRQLFVEPTCTTGRVSPEEFDAAIAGGRSLSIPLLPLLSGTNRRIVLLADPGMGKSTLIQWIITALAEEGPLPLAAEGLKGAIPLPFILRDLVSHLPTDAERWDWDTLLRAFTQYHPRSSNRPPITAGITGDEASFRSLLASNRALFLIDGFDEISDPVRRRYLRNALWSGFERYPFARWLITSRWVGYEEAEVHQSWQYYGGGCGGGSNVATERAKLVYLAPFDNSQQLSFAQHWYLPRMGEALGSDHATSFVKAVHEHESVRVIGRVPNLLYLLALLFRNRARLPHGRTLVYSAISEAYLGGIDLTKHLHVPYELGKKERLLATVARQMQERRMAEVVGEHSKKNKGETLGEILVKRVELHKWLSPHFPGDTALEALDAFINYVAARSGLLLPRGEGVFGFAHLSFQEYYAACWLEEEFRRLLNVQALSGVVSFFRRPAVATSSGTLAREDFTAFAGQTIWRESLVFLVEKVSNNTDDTLTLIDWLFPQLSSPPTRAAGPPPELMPVEAARLLASLSLDPQVCLTLEHRRSIWEILWMAHLEQQDGRVLWHLSPALLVASEYQSAVWEVLVGLKPDRLLLCDCTGLQDLAPLSKLTQLLQLDLNGCTTITDFTPLSGLKELRSLWVDRCTGLADLSPLKNLTQLRSLNFSDCPEITDLSPIATLTQLHELYLKRCVRVNNLSPVYNMLNLEKLMIEGCASISITEIDNLRNTFPDLNVWTQPDSPNEAPKE